MNEKIMWLLEHYYNLFHADMISRAIFDDNVSLEGFIDGCCAIGLKEDEDDGDEFVPKAFENV